MWDLHRSTKREVKEEQGRESSVRYNAKRCKVVAVFDGDTMLARAKEFSVIEFYDSDDEGDDNDQPVAAAVGSGATMATGTAINCERVFVASTDCNRFPLNPLSHHRSLRQILHHINPGSRHRKV